MLLAAMGRSAHHSTAATSRFLTHFQRYPRPAKGRAVSWIRDTVYGATLAPAGCHRFSAKGPRAQRPLPTPRSMRCSCRPLSIHTATPDRRTLTITRYRVSVYVRSEAKCTGCYTKPVHLHITLKTEYETYSSICPFFQLPSYGGAA